MRVSSVLFDMDGLVIDSERLSLEAFSQEMTERGKAITLEQYTELLGANYDFTVNYLESLFPDINGKEFLAAYTRRYVAMVEGGAQRIKTGFFELSDFLRARGIKSAIASSNLEAMVMLNMEKLSIKDRFDALVYDGMAERAKPFPDLFLKAAELTETAAAECLVLEDSFAGIRAARAANMRAIMIPDLREPTAEILALCERRCDTLLGVIDYIKEQNGGE